MGLSVTVMKLDPSRNSDDRETEHWEQAEDFLLEDGSRVGPEFGIYERFLDISLTREHSISRRDLEQVNSQCCSRGHRSDKISNTPDQLLGRIEKAARIAVDGTVFLPDVCIIDLGYSANSQDMAPFLKVLQRLRARAGFFNFMRTLVVPAISKSMLDDEEFQSVDLWKYTVDMVCSREHQRRDTTNVSQVIYRRGENDGTEVHVRSSIAPPLEDCLDLDASHILSVDDNADALRLPLLLEGEKKWKILIPGDAGSLMRMTLRLDEVSVSVARRTAGAEMWTTLSQVSNPASRHCPGTGKFVFIGKTSGSKGPHTITAWSNRIANSYTAIMNSLYDASHSLPMNDLTIVDPSSLSFKPDDQPDYLHLSWAAIRAADGIIIPDSHHHATPDSAYVKRAKISIAAYARTSKIPFLGIGAGMHAAVEGFAQNVSNLPHPVPGKGDFLPPVIYRGAQAGGVKNVYIPPSGRERAQEAFRLLYGAQVVESKERFDFGGSGEKRIHPAYAHHMSSCGFDFFCQNENGMILGAWKYAASKHPFYVGVEFHPEYRSRVLGASDVIFEFVKAVDIHGQKKRDEMDRKKEVMGRDEEIMLMESKERTQLWKKVFGSAESEKL
jgi:CTP synthase